MSMYSSSSGSFYISVMALCFWHDVVMMTLKLYAFYSSVLFILSLLFACELCELSRMQMVAEFTCSMLIKVTRLIRLVFSCNMC